MEGFATLIILIAFFGMIFGLIGLIKGNMKFLKLHSRKASGVFVIAMFVLFIVGGALLPTNEEATTTEVDKQQATEEKSTSLEQTEDSESDEENQVKNDDVPVDEDEKANNNTSTNNDSVVNDSLPQNNQGELEVHFVDVGQGAAQVIITPNNKVMVIDSGNNDDEDDMVAYLSQLGVKKVDILIGTHPDADHIGGMDAVIDSFDIGKIYMPRVQRDTQTFESVLTSIQNKGLKVTTASAGLTLDLDPAVDVEMIGPIGTHSDANEMSAIVRIQYGDHSFLLTGDAGIETEEKLIQAGDQLQSTVLLAGHHGSNHSTSKPFLNVVKPQHTVIQVGKNSYGHPTDEVLQRLSAVESKIYRNDTDGTIIFTTDGTYLKVNKNAWVFTGAKKQETKSTPNPVNTPAPSQAPKEPSNNGGTITATASIDDPNPGQNEQVTVTVQVVDGNNNPVNGANVSLLLHYKSTDTTYEGITNSNGTAVIDFRIGRAAKGFTVKGDVTVQANGKTAKAYTSFTPQ